ncbi:hypothetical protein JOQ06_004577 [Pogonophryne albipinna]|uniref:SPIN-DOC-like zinc-finger domain-containing protein n=1 Tax=Pogonophryne albipinna TaxID=1090488 RepID=A0AAD6ANR8_9TELE|nr:hypothetical protein JOQ06_004577 [Pogonophryne albipinna]
MSTSKLSGKRKVDDDNRRFQEKWETEYFFVEYRGNATCLICTEKIAIYKEYNVKRHYSTKHAEYAKYLGEEREKRVTELKKCLWKQRNLFKKGSNEADLAVEASYVVSEMIAMAGKPFTEGEFIKKCMLQAASIVCPEKKGQFNNMSLSANTVAERISDLSSDIYDQLCDKAKLFCAYSVALDERTDITDTAQLAMYVQSSEESPEDLEALIEEARGEHEKETEETSINENDIEPEVVLTEDEKAIKAYLSEGDPLPSQILDTVIAPYWKQEPYK